MKISKGQFEMELDGLITAALMASSKATARGLLIQAENKIRGYDNIPSDLQENYRQKIQDARDELDL